MYNNLDNNIKVEERCHITEDDYVDYVALFEAKANTIIDEFKNEADEIIDKTIKECEHRLEELDEHYKTFDKLITIYENLLKK